MGAKLPAESRGEPQVATATGTVPVSWWGHAEPTPWSQVPCHLLLAGTSTPHISQTSSVPRPSAKPPGAPGTGQDLPVARVQQVKVGGSALLGCPWSRPCAREHCVVSSPDKLPHKGTGLSPHFFLAGGENTSHNAQHRGSLPGAPRSTESRKKPNPSKDGLGKRDPPTPPLGATLSSPAPNFGGVPKEPGKGEDVRFHFVEEAAAQHHDQRADEQGSGAHGAASITAQRRRPSPPSPRVPGGWRPCPAPVSSPTGLSPAATPRLSLGLALGGIRAGSGVINGQQMRTLASDLRT